jgi:RimJ/RimL family protein N-acetyltransferase
MILKSDHVYLRKVDPNDAELIANWKDDPFVKKMSIGTKTVISKENQKADIERSIENEQPYFIIHLNENNKAIGYIRINWMDDHNLFAWLRFGLGEERGKGYAKEALTLYTNHLFRSGVHRIDAEVFAFNSVSFNLLKKIGFNHEGTKQEAHFDQNTFYDVYVLGMLNSTKK